MSDSIRAMLRIHPAAPPLLFVVMAFVIFGERLTLLQIAGFLVALVGVVLARRGTS